MKTGPIGEALEVLQEEVEEGAQTAAQQITGKQQGQVQTSAGKQSGQGSAATKPQGMPPPPKPSEQTKPQGAPEKIPQSEETKAFVKDMYGGELPSVSDAQVKQKELEDKQKMEALRQKLHREYYERLVKPPKPQEERPVQKVEREEEEKKLALGEEEEKKKKQELPVIVTKDMGTKEKLRGVSG